MDVDEELRNADWNRLGRDLVAHALVRAQIFGWYVGPDDTLAGGVTARDVVARAIEDVLTGRRDRARAAHLTLRAFMKGVVNSLLWRVANSAVRAHETRHPPGPNDSDEVTMTDEIQCNALEIEATRHLFSAPPDPESALEARIRGRDAAKRLARLRSALASEPALLELFDEMAKNGADARPRHLARSMGVSREEIYQRKKRIRRVAAQTVLED